MDVTELRAMPKTRLVAVVRLLDWLSGLSDGRVSVPELADAISNVFDADSMALYDAGGYGLASPIGDRLGDEIGYNARVNVITDLYNSRYWDNEDAMAAHGHYANDVMLGEDDGFVLAEKLWRFFFPGEEFPSRRETFLNSMRSVVRSSSENYLVETSGVLGPTFARLQRTIAAFPVRYPDYQSQPPKLKDDVRPWLKEAGLAGNDREAHVFGTIIAEHFKLLGDTHET